LRTLFGLTSSKLIREGKFALLQFHFFCQIVRMVPKQFVVHFLIHLLLHFPCNGQYVNTMPQPGQTNTGTVYQPSNVGYVPVQQTTITGQPQIATPYENQWKESDRNS
jgi:hypothetical protein